MNFTIFEPKSNIDLEKFVRFWSKYYGYKGYKWEELYTNAISKPKLDPQDVHKLFFWKNGVRLSKKKAMLVDKIVSRIDIVNKLRGNFNQDIFDKEFNFIKGAIWKIFLLHVIDKYRFPIFDQYVYYACSFLKDGEMKKMPLANVTKMKFYYEVYINFFNDLVERGGG